MIGTHGNADIPQRPEELCEWIDSLPLEQKHPKWVGEGIAMLCESNEEVAIHFGAGSV